MNDQMKKIAEFFSGMPFHFVGGCVRDIVLGIEPKDYDLITPYTPDEIEAYIRAQRNEHGVAPRVYEIGRRFGTLGVKIGGQVVEITTYRAETYDMVSRKPDVSFTTELTADLERRDFTINALVMNKDGKITDPLSYCRADVQNKILRTVGVAKQRFEEDPLRILRGVRMAAKYGLRIESTTLKRMESRRWEMLRLSKERIADELLKMLMLPEPQMVRAMTLMFELKLWQVVFPSLQLAYKFDQVNPHHKLFLHNHMIAVAAGVRRMLDDLVIEQWFEKYSTIRPAILVLAGLLHDVAKPYTATLHKSGTYNNYINHDILGAEMADQWMRAMKFSTEDREFVVSTIREHLQDTSWLRKYDHAGKALGAQYTAEGL